MKSTDLIDRIATATGGTKADAKTALDTVFTSIVEAAAKGDDVSIPGFGKFQVRETAARQGRNPKTGETIEIAASKKLAFSPAKNVKDSLSAK
ncbi:histone-like DNA-binding protein HU [Neoasaia chiangmaiensis NBRC 101099]|uniref:Integration host factor n=2 Tax=Neoasaia chiangmaiensis TaxID=320497 RepID=A0A1U9KSA6_9PROT|nr:integration host factor [Neoasaia chiangmaiensis]GBR36128.1 histone-like DNA-binding protein HU [Neoasaia chiangmaiensis NBRC 101099]GEN15464.1 integration host factor [Neoasaia chiangmaiensis]